MRSRLRRHRQGAPGDPRQPQPGFSYYRRAIISDRHLQNAGRYRYHLRGHIHTDAVVIDECHNLVNWGTLQQPQLARVLAPRTEALLLTSATPHNGDP
ncbi:MAG: hypothetical protein IPF42_16930 [Candidatus Microthrix sp.]|nr:hypothetical protein [Candidatus Microthrix sp.]